MITKHDVTPPRPRTPSTREDSHAFSLDSLRALEATRAPAVAQAADSSGVIDLDELRLAGPRSVADDLTTSRLVSGPDPMPPPPPSTPRWAVATLGLLGGAVVALTTMVALGMPHGTQATQDPAPRPTMAAAVLDHDDDQVAHGLHAHGALIPHVAEADTAAAAMPTAEPEPEPVAKPAPKARSKSKRTKTKRAAANKAKTKASKPAAAPKSVAKPESKTQSQDALSVQCIVDPASCGRGAAKPKAKPSTPTVSLPTKLSSSQIRKALTGPKSEAKQCRDMHAAAAGTTVKVKLSIAGSGKVRSAVPQAPHANSLGRCVAAALSTASFDAFGSPAMGVVYSVRL
ncbi:MAG: hypothetical protein ACRBN8_16665 [Nannocystales bacterium]